MVEPPDALRRPGADRVPRRARGGGRGPPPTRRATRVSGKRSPTRRRGPRKPSRSALPDDVAKQVGQFAVDATCLPRDELSLRMCRCRRAPSAALAPRRSPARRARVVRESCTALPRLLERPGGAGHRGPASEVAESPPLALWGLCMEFHSCATQCRLGTIFAPPSRTNG